MPSVLRTTTPKFSPVTRTTTNRDPVRIESSRFSDGFDAKVKAPKVNGVFPPPKVPQQPLDSSSLKPGTLDVLKKTMDLEPEQIASIFSSGAYTPEFQNRVGMVITEQESNDAIPERLAQQFVESGESISSLTTRLGITDDVSEKYEAADPQGKVALVTDLFATQFPGWKMPIATLEALANNSDAGLDRAKDVLGLGDSTIAKFSGTNGLDLSAAYSEMDPTKRLDLLTRMYRDENHIPSPSTDLDMDALQSRIDKLKSRIDADKNKPGILSKVGDFALASLVNIASDYFLFNALKYKDPSQHDGQPISIAYRAYQVALQAYSSLWLGANDGTGTAAAFWNNQWSGANDFGYGALGLLTNKVADGLGVGMADWDGKNWFKVVMNGTPDWFNWAQGPLSHPGQPTTGSLVLNGVLNSAQTTTALLLDPSLGTPWRDSKGTDFVSKTTRFFSRFVPGSPFH